MEHLKSKFIFTSVELTSSAYGETCGGRVGANNIVASFKMRLTVIAPRLLVLSCCRNDIILSCGLSPSAQLNDFIPDVNRFGITRRKVLFVEV